MSIHQTSVWLSARQTMKIFIVLTILTSKLYPKSSSLTKFFLSWRDFHSYERSFECRSQQLCSLWSSCLQWAHFFDSLRNSLLFSNFRFLSNWAIILLKLKFFSEFDHLSWSTKTIVMSSINRSNLLILTLCIRSKMYDSRLSLRSRRKRLLSIHDWIVFSMSEHLTTTCLSEFTSFWMNLKFNCFVWVSFLIVRNRMIKFNCSYWVFRIDHILMTLSALIICILNFFSQLKSIISLTLSFLSSQCWTSVIYFFLSAVETLNDSDVDFFSFSEMIIQRSLTFKTLIIFFFHDS